MSDAKQAREETTRKLEDGDLSEPWWYQEESDDYTNIIRRGDNIFIIQLRSEELARRMVADHNASFLPGGRPAPSINSLAAEIHRQAIIKGFWPEYDTGAPWDVPKRISLMHSELSEALEAHRKDNPPDEHCPEHSSMAIEFADVVIRVLDTCAALKLPIGEAIEAKMAYNRSRPYKHGKGY